MKETNEKKNKNSISLLKKLTSTKKKTTNFIKSESPTNSNSKINITNAITLSPEEMSKELDTVVKTNENSKIVEYYDLPYRYNQTVIKILAQTPHSIFIYWDISDADKNSMIEKYGKNFFYETKPILLVHNQTLNYSFEIEIDDFTNSWYLSTPTSDCVFNIELGRKFVKNNNIKTDDGNNILHITSSNTIESPNDHVLKQTFNQPIYFKNIKNNKLEVQNISNLKAINNIYNIFETYEDDDLKNNPSSDFRI